MIDIRGAKDLMALTIWENLMRFLNHVFEFRDPTNESWKMYYKSEFSNENLLKSKLKGKENKKPLKK